MKIVFERNKCIGCGACAATCPENWELAEDGKSKLLGSKLNPTTKNYEKDISEAGCNQEAAEGCPVQCIHMQK